MAQSIDILTDYHIHTRLCNHASGEMEEYVEAALLKGLRRIVFLEHFEIGISYFESTWLSMDDFIFYRSEGNRLKEKYRNKIQVGIGVEIGYNPDHVADTVTFLEKYRWDWVGLSYHFLKSDGMHANLVSKRKANLEALGRIGLDRVITLYLKQLLQAIEEIPANMLCHLDAVLRHHPGVHFLPEHHRLIRKLLQGMVAKKMALEVNTSGFPVRGEPFPSAAILREALDLGLPLAASSDAHRPADVGRHFDKLPALLHGQLNRTDEKGKE